MAYLNPSRLSLLADTSISSPSNTQILVYNNNKWENQAFPTSSFTLSDGSNSFLVTGGDTITWQSGASPNNIFDFDFSVADTPKLGWATPPTTGGSNHQVLIFNDTNDTYSWGDPIIIDPASSSYLSYNSANRHLSVSNLLITDTTVDTTQVSIAAYVGTSPTHQEGDIVILTNATGGSQTWIHNGGTSGTTADYTQILNGASMSSFTVAGNTGTNQSITNGNTLTIAGTNGLGSIGVNTDTIQVELGGVLTKQTVIAGTSNNLVFTATSGNIDFGITGTGEIKLAAPTGGVVIGGGAAVTPLRFREASGNGTNYASLQAASSMATNNTYTLPNAYPTVSGQVLSSNTSGVMSWVTASGGSTGSFDITDGTTTQTITVDTDTITFNNGLSVSATDTVKLGGTFTGNTTLTGNTYNLTYSSTSGGFKALSTGAAIHQMTTVGGAIILSNTTGNINVTNTTGTVTVGPSTTGDLVLQGQRIDKNGTEQSLVNSRATTYTIAPGSDSYIYFSAASANATINLPVAPETGDVYHIKCTSVANTATLNGNGQNIDGSGSFVFDLNNQAITVVYNGTQWLIY